MAPRGRAPGPPTAPARLPLPLSPREHTPCAGGGSGGRGGRWLSAARPSAREAAAAPRGASPAGCRRARSGTGRGGEGGGRRRLPRGPLPSGGRGAPRGSGRQGALALRGRHSGGATAPLAGAGPGPGPGGRGRPRGRSRRLPLLRRGCAGLPSPGRNACRSAARPRWSAARVRPRPPSPPQRGRGREEPPEERAGCLGPLPSRAPPPPRPRFGGPSVAVGAAMPQGRAGRASRARRGDSGCPQTVPRRPRPAGRRCPLLLGAGPARAACPGCGGGAPVRQGRPRLPAGESIQLFNNVVIIAEHP